VSRSTAKTRRARSELRSRWGPRGQSPIEAGIRTKSGARVVSRSTAQARRAALIRAALGAGSRAAKATTMPEYRSTSRARGERVDKIRRAAPGQAAMAPEAARPKPQRCRSTEVQAARVVNGSTNSDVRRRAKPRLRREPRCPSRIENGIQTKRGARGERIARKAGRAAPIRTETMPGAALRPGRNP
jgi:hypothetical protein